MVPKALFLTLSLACSPALADFAADEFPPYERCALCHGLFGVSHTAKFPNLAGQKPAYIEAQIRAFLSGARTNDGGQMAAIVTELKPEEIPVVIDWFSTQSPPDPGLPPDTDTGRTTFVELGCDTCHDTPLGDPPNVPHLSAQHSGYLKKQMSDFRDGVRTGGEISAMHRSLLTLEDAALAEIADYLNSVERP